MKFTILKNDVVSLVNKIQGIVPTKPQMPILSNVLLRASENQLFLSATDLNISIESSIKAQITEEGSLVLPSKKLFSLLKELTSPEIEISSSNSHTATIRSGTSQFKIHGISPEEFPETPTLADETRIGISASILKEMLSQTVFAAGKDDSRPVFSSVLLQRTDSLTTFTGTNGKKLAKTYTNISLPEEWQGTFIVPSKAAEEMINLLDTKEEEAVLRFSSDKVSLQVGETTLTSQLISGHYPDVSKIIPEKTENPIKLHREELMTLLRQVSLFTTADRVSIRFTFGSGELTLSIAGGETGEGRVSMPVNYHGDTIEIGFHPTNLLDILRHSKDETVDLHLKDGYNPGLITDSTNTIFVIMPMRLES